MMAHASMRWSVHWMIHEAVNRIVGQKTAEVLNSAAALPNAGLQYRTHYRGGISS